MSSYITSFTLSLSHVIAAPTSVSAKLTPRASKSSLTIAVKRGESVDEMIASTAPVKPLATEPTRNSSPPSALPVIPSPLLFGS